MNKHLLNAETQIASEVASLATRFMKAKRNRLALAHKLLGKCRELAQASELLHGNEPAVVIPGPLPHPLAEQRSHTSPPPAYHVSPISEAKCDNRPTLGETLVDIAATQKSFGINKP